MKFNIKRLVEPEETDKSGLLKSDLFFAWLYNEIIRFDHFGNKEDLGIFTLNPGVRISEIETEITPQKTIKFSFF